MGGVLCSARASYFELEKASGIFTEEDKKTQLRWFESGYRSTLAEREAEALLRGANPGRFHAPCLLIFSFFSLHYHKRILPLCGAQKTAAPGQTRLAGRVGLAAHANNISSSLLNLLPQTSEPPIYLALVLVKQTVIATPPIRYPPRTLLPEGARRCIVSPLARPTCEEEEVCEFETG